ncbi:hypothetical protein [Marinobacter sp. SS21]|uniref:hypothetical protein n=1 Tax=Marinobacter sp. SS21 TaxID=2979460 RepID=UPI002330A15F|nr:hypothetical protein [Marinobacter sp. SS21]MDC0664312.1 hypothetical protein [Marinobacter sp. SS21]
MVIRAIGVAVLIVGLLAFAVLGPRWLMQQSPGNEEEQLPACNLQGDECQWQSGDEHWQARIEEVEFSEGLHRFRLEMTTDARPQRLHGVLVGESMYLGEYPVVLKPMEAPGRWSATFAAPLCTVQEVMVWRLELTSGEQVLEHVPFRLIFTAQGR